MAYRNQNKTKKSSNKSRQNNQKGQRTPKSNTTKEVNQNIPSSEDVEEKGTSKRPANNPLYFIPSEQAGLLESLTGFSFPQVMGESRKITSSKYGVGGQIDIQLPTASRIRVSPTIGPIPAEGGAALNAAPINVAGTSTFVALSSFNNKQTLYAPQDVQLLVLSVGQLYAIEEFIRRAFKFSFIINSNNLAVPRTYYTAMGIDFDDYRQNLANYRDQFNVLITKINSIRFMYNIPYLKKCYEIYQGSYKDSLTNLYGMHFVVPATTWQLNDIKNEQGGGLDTVQVVPANGVRLLSEYLTILENMISAVRTSSTFNVIYSDILALYERAGFETLEIPLFFPGEQTIEEYNPMFNIMLRHATITGSNAAEPDPEAPAKYQTTGNDVVSDPDNNALYMQYAFKQNTDYLAYDRIVNFFETNSPDAATRFEMTRWMVIGNALKSETSGGVKQFITDSPVIQDTVVNSVALYLGDQQLEGRGSNVIHQVAALTFNNTSYWMKMANLPMLVFAEVDGDQAITNAQVLGDIDAWSSVDAQYLTNIANQTMIYYFGSI
jgi:hypothetical protein